MIYQIMAEKPSKTPGEKIVLRIDFPTYTEAWMSMDRLANDGWRITETPKTVEFPRFTLDIGSAA